MRYLIFFILLLSFSLNAQTLAFPDAIGAGADTVTGGRGENVYHVTSLADSGAGTLRQAILDARSNGGGTIVFDVSGVISLLTDIDLAGNGDSDIIDPNAGNITIAGQTAPEGGITIDVSSGIIDWFNIHNLIFRYLKFRGDGSAGFIEMTYCNKIIVDHCSFSWGNFGFTNIVLGSYTDHVAYTPGDITFSNNLVAHIGRPSTIGNTGGGAPGVDPDTLPFGEVSMIRNAYIQTSYRLPLKFGGAGKVDVINNYIQSPDVNFGGRMMRFDNQAFRLNHISNYYDEGAYGNTDETDLHKVWTTDTLIAAEIYQDDNFYSTNLKPTNYDIDNTLDWREFYTSPNPVPNSWFVLSQHTLNGQSFPIIPASTLKDSLTPEIGASKYIDNNGDVVLGRDFVDERYVTDLETNNYRAAERTGLSLAAIPNNTRPVNFYGTNQHIPTAWLTANGYADTINIHNQVEPDGYTVLEHYINQVDGAVTPPTAVTSVSIAPSTANLSVGNTIKLTETVLPVDASNKTGVWSSSSDSIATVSSSGLVTGISNGVATITFTTNDGSFTDTSTITVITPSPQPSNKLSKKIKTIIISNN